jgi:hypothetical protein
MNVLLVMVLGWLALGLETGLKSTLSLRWGMVTAAPSFVLPLAVFIALCAPPVQATWACLILGLFLDLTAPQPTYTGELVVIGPYAIGLVIACQLVLALRGLVMRRNPLTVVLLSVLAGVVMQIVVTAFFTARAAVGDEIVWHTSHELLGRLVSAGITGGTAFVIAILLSPMAPLLGMPVQRSWIKR